MTQPQKYSFTVAVTVVIANMIGTGVFGSLGFQVGPIPSGFSILILWLAGGVVSLCGAFVYAELATTLKESGGEYLFLSRIFHPSIGFLSGWISVVWGFAGALSANAIIIGAYSQEVLGLPEKLIACASIVVVTAIHWFGVRVGGVAQNFLTGVKLTLILGFCLAPFLFGGARSGLSFVPTASDLDLILSSGWAVSLVYVIYAYSGWNAAAYIAGSIEHPQRNLPRALIMGTLLVTVIYLALNFVFLYVTPFELLENKKEIGNIAASQIFGSSISLILSGFLSFALLSTLSAMTIAGPRVTEAMGKDYSSLKVFSNTNRFGMPHIAMLLQAFWSIFLVLFSNFTQIIGNIAVSLSIFTLLSIIGLFVLRQKNKGVERVFSTPGYPVTPLVFIFVTCWMIVHESIKDPMVLLYSLGTVAIGLVLYFFAAKKK
jgi:basic amino acid/polyamine antiporter, APA family